MRWAVVGPGQKAWRQPPGRRRNALAGAGGLAAPGGAAPGGRFAPCSGVHAAPPAALEVAHLGRGGTACRGARGACLEVARASSGAQHRDVPVAAAEAACSRLLSPPATSSSRSAIRKLLEALRWPVKGQSTTRRMHGSSAPSYGQRLALLRAWAFASLRYTPPLYTNCSNCSFTSVGGSRTGPPRRAMTARRAAQQAAFCFRVRPRRRVAGVKRAAGRADEGKQDTEVNTSPEVYT